MSVDKVSQRREMRGYCVTVSVKGPMGWFASNIIAKDIKKFLDFLEMRAQEFEP